ncbi:MAG: ParA family protein [Planctomycetaceae bacterium]|nr:ParA family protein [Planctomycetaceae bacterium]
MITFCLINQKGGCGKSSTCFHLSGALATSGMNVLLVDLDPQGSLSQGFLGPALVEQMPLIETIALLFDENSFFTGRDGLVHSTSFERISLCPANQLLAPFNTPQPELTGQFQYVVREFLNEQKERFDVCLIDCPPNLYRCSWTAMVAADEVIIPVPPEDFGTQGLRAVHQSILYARQLNHRLHRLGHLISRRDQRLVIHRKYEQSLRNQYGEMVLETVIPETSAFKVALTCRKPVEYHDPHSAAAQITRQLANEILTLAARRQSKRRVA